MASVAALLRKGASDHAAAAGRSAAVDGDVVAQYFSGAYRGRLAHHRRWRPATVALRLVAGLFGLALLSLTVYDVWRHFGTPFMWPWPSSIARTPAWVGTILAGVALPNGLWSRGWEPAALVVALAAGLELAFVGLGNRAAMIALIVCAVALLAVGLWLRLRRTSAPQGLAEIEPRIDAWTRRRIDAVVRDLPLPGVLPEGRAVEMRMRTLPRAVGGSTTAFACRLGVDGRPRVSPAGVASFLFGPASVVIVDAAVDIASGNLLYRQVRELPYAQITGLVWTTETDPPGDQAKAPAPQKPAARLPRGISRTDPPNRSDVMEVRLTDGTALRFVLGTTAVLPQSAEDGVEPIWIERPEHVREIWQALTARAAGQLGARL